MQLITVPVIVYFRYTCDHVLWYFLQTGNECNVVDYAGNEFLSSVRVCCSNARVLQSMRVTSV